MHSPRAAVLDAKKSADLRDRLWQEIAACETDDALAVWAYRSLPLKNTLTKNDAEAVEAACLSKVEDEPVARTAVAESAPSFAREKNDNSPALVTFRTKSARRRSKAHLAFVASQPCLICKTTPCDAHHLEIAQPRSPGRKVSDEYTVPLCREHHRDLHQLGNEAVSCCVRPLGHDPRAVKWRRKDRRKRSSVEQDRRRVQRTATPAMRPIWLPEIRITKQTQSRDRRMHELLPANRSEPAECATWHRSYH